MKVLFVDQDAYSKRLSEIIQRATGHETTFSTDAKDALIAAAKGNIDIIILDTTVEFTGYDDKEEDYLGRTDVWVGYKRGVQALIKIKEVNPAQRVIVTTTSPRPEFKKYLQNIGAEAILVKPFQLFQPDGLGELLK